MRQGPLWIVEPPLSTGERMSVNDPLRTYQLVGAVLQRGERHTVCDGNFLRVRDGCAQVADEPVR